MPYLLAAELKCFDTLPLKSRLIVLRRYLDALAQANIEYLLQNPKTPPLYNIGASYEIKKRPFSLDSWYDLPTVLEKKSGDCKDFSAIRVAELYLNYPGQPVGFYIKTQQVWDPTKHDNLIVYHIQIEGYHRGRFIREDPSKLLGMPTAATLTPQQFQQILAG